jgi:anti-anti-sigma factor
MISFKEVAQILYIRAEGHITARYCSEIKHIVFTRLDTEPPVNGIHVDLQDCSYMDSTFMGLLAGFSRKLKKLTGSRLTVQNLHDTCRSLLKAMGMLPLLDILDTPMPFPEPLLECTEAEQTTAEDILFAHEELMDISDENKEKFSVLHQALSDRIEREKAGK